MSLTFLLTTWPSLLVLLTTTVVVVAVMVMVVVMVMTMLGLMLGHGKATSKAEQQSSVRLPVRSGGPCRTCLGCTTYKGVILQVEERGTHPCEVTILAVHPRYGFFCFC